MVNSRRKGSKSERAASKLFEKWTGYEFARTPSSGGLPWKNRSQVTGDIICTDEKHSRRFRFSVEIKFHKDIRFDHLLTGVKKSSIRDFWTQASRDADNAGKIPMLLMRYNNMAKDMYFLVIPLKLYTRMADLIPITYGLMTYVGEFDIAIINSVDFFKADYNLIHKISKEYLKDATS